MGSRRAAWGGDKGAHQLRAGRLWRAKRGLLAEVAALPRLGAVGGTRLLPSRHRAKSRPHTHRNSWRERGGAYPAPLAATLAALRLSLKPIRRSVAARRFFGGQSCNFDAMHLGQNATLASWALRADAHTGFLLYK